MLLNCGPIRRPLDTIDYTDDRSDALPLVRARSRLPLILDKKGLAGVDPSREQQRIPRLSMLERFERDYSERLARARRRFVVASTVAFVVGVLGGLVLRPSGVLRSSDLVHHVQRWTGSGSR